MKKLIILIIAAVSLVSAQYRDAESRPDPRLKFLSSSGGALFDMSKLSVSHSLSMSYFNTGSGSVMLNEYIAGINYQISDPLTLKLNLGMSYTPYSSFLPAEENSTDIYLKSATLDYRPNDTFRMRVDFRTVRPSDYINADPFRQNDYFNDSE
ncbi:MAG TPA: hypothetical protein PLK90_04255 [Clostridiales bacterium]|nr:hypothetical protein [Clostridiales bacterium]HQP69594.1 hypothetical protein [Clostridiales bacterium]